MKKLFSAIAVTAVLAASGGVALAGPYYGGGGYKQVPYEPQPRPELYIFGYGGVNWLNDLQANSRTDGPFSLDVGTDDGYGVGGGLGLRFPVFLGGRRIIKKGFYRANDSEGALPSNAFFGGSGDVVQNGIMVNFVKEFAWRGLVPYAGIGAGYGSTDLDIDYPGGILDAEETTFNWQAILGMEFPFWERVSLYAEYRYLSVGDFSMEATSFGDTFTMDFDDFTNHSVFGGLRIYF